MKLVRNIANGIKSFSCMSANYCFKRIVINDSEQIHRSCSQYHKKQRPTGGGRPLIDPKKIFEYNNWDNVVWDEEQEQEARQKVEKNSQTPVSEDMKEKYESEADEFWDKFYNQHQNRFFKDRHWLFTEFPELAPDGAVPDGVPVKAAAPCGEPAEVSASVQEPPKESKDASSRDSNVEGKPAAPMAEPDISNNTFPGEHARFRMLEVGCGVGNTVFPVLQTNNDPGVFVYCCDLSKTAIDLVREHADYRESRCHAFVCDVTDPSAPFPCPEGSLDLVILIFVLSAIHPDKMQSTISRLSRLLKPGGMILFRDYGRYDLAQLRFKDGQCLSDNFYVRGDGTRVYFFTQDELKELFSIAGLVEEQNLIDRRLQVNRGRQLKMYRVWIQCKYRKPNK